MAFIRKQSLVHITLSVLIILELIDITLYVYCNAVTSSLYYSNDLNCQYNGPPSFKGIFFYLFFSLLLFHITAESVILVGHVLCFKKVSMDRFTHNFFLAFIPLCAIFHRHLFAYPDLCDCWVRAVSRLAAQPDAARFLSKWGVR